MQYEPYGDTLVQRGSLDFAPKYNSQELDRETNFYFYNARYYDPQIARFTSADSVIDGAYDTQGWNRFAYVKGNPIRFKDPTGHLVNNVQDMILKGVEAGSKAVQGAATEAAKAAEGVATQASKALPKVASNTLKVLGTLGTLVTPSGPVGDVSDEITGTRVFEHERIKAKEREPGWASVRFQLQQGKHDHYWDAVRVNDEKIGVLKRQGFNAIDQLDYDVKNKNLHKPLPKGFYKSEKFHEALSKMRAKIDKNPMPKSINKTNLQETFYFRGKEYRIDVENQSGQNNFVNY